MVVSICYQIFLAIIFNLDRRVRNIFSIIERMQGTYNDCGLAIKKARQ
jgi:hypothetical protein